MPSLWDRRKTAEMTNQNTKLRARAQRHRYREQGATP